MHVLYLLAKKNYRVLPTSSTRVKKLIQPTMHYLVINFYLSHTILHSLVDNIPAIWYVA